MAKKLSKNKAEKILHDKQVKGRPLTEKQRKFFGAVASGAVPQAQIGDILRPITPESVGKFLDLFSVPQKALTKLVTGKYQTPSEAMNIQNPVGAFVTDMVLDPLNVFGGGVIAKSAMAKKAASQVAKKAASSSTKKGVVYESDIVFNPKYQETLKKAVSSQKDRIKKYLDVDEAIEEGEGWKYSPEEIERYKIQKDLDEEMRGMHSIYAEIPMYMQRLYPEYVFFENIKKNAVKNFTSQPSGAQWKGGPTSYSKSDMAKFKNQEEFLKHFGKERYKELMKEYPKDYEFSTMDFLSLPKNQQGGSIESRMGGLTDKGFNYNGAWGGQFAMGGMLPGVQGHMYARTGAPSEGKYAKKTLPSAAEGYEILPDPTDPERKYKLSAVVQSAKDILNPVLRSKNPKLYDEWQKGRVEAIRSGDVGKYDVEKPLPIYLTSHEMKTELSKHNKKYYDEYITALKELDMFKGLGRESYAGQIEGDKPLENLLYGYRLSTAPVNLGVDKPGEGFRYAYNPSTGEYKREVMKGGGKMVSYYQQGLDFQPKTISKKGSKIKKDNDGYWNPENWGKPVEIDSNEITMQGVYEPLLGVSDTGDTQMMFPGEDYTFEGNSVTEYPVAQNGKKLSYNQWKKQYNLKETPDYNLKRAWQLGYVPDETGHLPTVDNQTGKFLKAKTHPTINLELEWYNSPEAADFRSKNAIDSSGKFFKYVPKGQTGINQLDAQPNKKLDQLLNFTNFNDMANAKKGKKIPKGLSGVPNINFDFLKKGINTVTANNIGAGIQAGSKIGQAVQRVIQAVEQKKMAKQTRALAEPVAQAAATRDVDIPNMLKRQLDDSARNAITANDVGVNPFGSGYDVLSMAQNGAEIQNTYAPNTLYNDLGYEPLDESSKVKQFERGGGIPKAALGQTLGLIGQGANVAGDIIAGIIGLGTKNMNEQSNELLGQAAFQSGMQGLLGGQYGGYMKHGGDVGDEYKWVSHSWQPQVIAKFGEHGVKDLLKPDPMMDTLRAGGHLKEYTPPSERAMSTERPQFAMGGELKTLWGGRAEPISYNPYLPDEGETVMFKGQYHSQSDGKGNTGIGVAFGKNPNEEADVEVEGGESATKLKKGGELEPSLVVFGNLKIPSYLASELGDKDAKGKMFKSYVNDLSKKEAKQNKIVDEALKIIDNIDGNSSFDLLAKRTAIAMLTGADMKLKEIAQKKMMAAGAQQAMHETADEQGFDVEQFINRGKIVQAKNGANTAQGGVYIPTMENLMSSQERKRLVNEGRKVVETKYNAGEWGTPPNVYSEEDLYKIGKQRDSETLDEVVVRGKKPTYTPLDEVVITGRKPSTKAPEKTPAKPAARPSAKPTPKAPTAKKTASATPSSYQPAYTAIKPNVELETPEFMQPVDFDKPLYTPQGIPQLGDVIKDRYSVTGVVPEELSFQSDYYSTPESEPFGGYDKTKRVGIPASMNDMVSRAVQAAKSSAPKEKGKMKGWDIAQMAYNELLPFIRPVNQMELDPSQLGAEYAALSMNVEQPVQAQFYQPMLLTRAPKMTAQDALNRNQADFNALARQVGNNPAALSVLAAQKQAADRQAIAQTEAFNIQQERAVTDANIGMLNDASLKNLAIEDTRFQRQSLAKSKTKEQAIEALKSIASKIGQNKLENMQSAVMQNMYNYRFGPKGRIMNYNPLAQFNYPQIANMTEEERKELREKLDKYEKGEKSAKNGSIVKAIKNL